MRVTAAMQSLIRKIGKTRGLDPAAEKLSGWVDAATRSPAVKNALSGSWLGHQAHPMLTDLPIGAWGAATVLDLTGADPAASRRLVGLGILASAPTAAAGASDWSAMYGPAKRVGLIHAAANATASTLQITSWFVRRRGHHGAGAVLSLLGLGLTLGSSYLGGHLSLVRGTGVNHTAFQPTVRRWTDVGADAELAEGARTRVMVDDVPVLLMRISARLHAISAVCTHAGGPLDEGELGADGCITCPWHGSRFRVEDGAVRRGPASVPQPRWEAKVEDGRILLRSA
ncbi:Ferredoxin, 2Fe-2S [Microbacterium sp. 8M]|uniref:Rieske 2Fe-2S domain-containing protein n=1 Tax=Microbacterium sp. 8M TaxID=2653153 RepID=UPI0012EFF5CE|nr:Rieske (2Fe-2S) protein [Microbacterium sp. 8M]VXC11248.1 Ferredoxin, 2Fe-2S [Microbacterium sp. 8M]